MDGFQQKLKNVVRIVLYGPAISQSDCRKTGQYQLPCNNRGIFEFQSLADHKWLCLFRELWKIGRKPDG